MVGHLSISHVDGARGRLIYRGHDAVALAESGPFESVWYLLHHGALPDAGELEAFRDLVRDAGNALRGRVVGRRARAAAASIDRGRPSPAAAVRSGLSALAGTARVSSPWLERPLDELRAEVLGLSAATAAVVVAGGRRPARAGGARRRGRLARRALPARPHRDDAVARRPSARWTATCRSPPTTA